MRPEEKLTDAKRKFFERLERGEIPRGLPIATTHWIGLEPLPQYRIEYSYGTENEIERRRGDPASLEELREKLKFTLDESTRSEEWCGTLFVQFDPPFANPPLLQRG